MDGGASMLELHVLRSGDKGSCSAVRLTGEQGFVCVDCGISGATFASACGQAGLVPFKVQAFLITHCHSNQVKGLKSTLTWLQKRGVAPAVYVEPGVLAASPVLQELQGVADMREFHTKQPFQVGGILVRPFRTFHNNEDKGSCYNFRFETCLAPGAPARSEGAEDVEKLRGAAVQNPPDSLVLLQDVGVLSREAQGELPHARLLAIETNYDSELLESAAQANAQVRFAVDVRGNFSNAQASSVVEKYAWPGLRDVVAMYLSRQYNAPERATAALQEAVAQAGSTARVTCSSPDECVSVLPNDAAVPCPEPDVEGAEAAGVPSSRAAEVPASPDAPASPTSPMPAGEVSEGLSVPLAPTPPDDILMPAQAQEMGYVDSDGLLATWEREGRFGEGGAPTSEALLAVLIAAGLLDARDAMPTDEGIGLGIWATYDKGRLAPIYAACMASALWGRIAGSL